MQIFRPLIAVFAFLAPTVVIAAPALCYQNMTIVRDKFSGEKDELFDYLKLGQIHKDSFDFRLLQYAGNYSRCTLAGHATRNQDGAFVFRSGETAGSPLSAESVIANPPCTITFVFDETSVHYSGSARCSTVCGSRFRGVLGGTLPAGNRCAEIGR